MYCIYLECGIGGRDGAGIDQDIVKLWYEGMRTWEYERTWEWEHEDVCIGNELHMSVQV